MRDLHNGLVSALFIFKNIDVKKIVYTKIRYSHEINLIRFLFHSPIFQSRYAVCVAAVRNQADDQERKENAK